jgi:hypothetical protein
VVVNNVVGIAPTVTISVPGTVTSVSTVNLTATATASGGGAITGVEFFLGRNSIGQAVRDQLTNTWRMLVSFVGLPLGNTEVVALAHDSAGNIAASPTGSINITSGTGVAPSVNVFATPTSVALGQFVVLTATAGSTTGTVTGVTYFANALNLGGRTTPPTPGQAGYQLTWTTAPVGTFNVYATATDNNGNTNVSAPVLVTVRRFEPVVDDYAFILQSYLDISNIGSLNVNLDLVTAYTAQMAAGTLTRAQLINTLITNDTGGFSAPVNLLAAYYAIMGEWPTPANYSTLLATARGSLPTAIGAILSSTRYNFLFSNGVNTSTGTLTTSFNASTTGFATLTAFATRLWQNAGLGTPSQTQVFQFQNNPTAVTAPPLGPLGRGYAASGVGLNTAIAEFVTITNSTNMAFQHLAQAAALYYQLDKPPTPDGTVDVVVAPIAARISVLAALPDTTTITDAVLKDILYTYRYVTILDSPQSLVVAPRSGALFRVDALGAPPVSYQWLFNGAPIAGAINSFLSLTNVDATKAGTYTVLVSSSYGSATSDPATLTLSSTPTRLGNISTRDATGGGADILIAGFVVTAPIGSPANQTRQMLIRVVGPSLAALGVTTGLLGNPRLEVYDAQGRLLLQNDNWGTQTGGAAAVTAIDQATTRTGAFALNGPNSLDAAVLATLAPGSYTVEAKGPTAAAAGIVLIEVYDASPTSLATNPKAMNVSTRGFAGTGANTLIAGFVINGAVSRRVLIRGVGPTLTRFGLPAGVVLADPQLELFDTNGVSLRVNDDWASGDDAAVVAAAAVAGGAFPLNNGSKDAAMLLMLTPGSYTVHLTGVGNTTGVGLVEVYDVDP